MHYKKFKQVLACGLIASILATQPLGNLSTVSAAEQGSTTVLNDEGLWLTEIYQNDVDRSAKNDSRNEGGYDEIHTYGNNTADLMEFLEMTSTYKENVNFNETFGVYYGDSKMTVTTMDGSSNIVIQPGQTVVLWNYREDLGSAIPTEAEFREDMRISDDTVILKLTSGKNWAVSSTFSIRTLTDNKILSTYSPVTAVDTADGLSVELEIPDIGSEMQVYRALTQPSAGTVYNGQMNGLSRKTSVQTSVKGVYITEIRANDSNRSSVYGGADDLMECVELVNTTDKAVELNSEYSVYYTLKEGQRKKLSLAHYDAQADGHIGSTEQCIIPAGGTVVLWCYREPSIGSNYTKFPTEEEFRAAYDIDDSVPVYLFANQNGLSNTQRGFEVYRNNADTTKTLVSNYFYNGTTDLKDNKSATLAVSPDGPEMLLQGACVATNMGVVDASQYTVLPDDGSSVDISLNDTVPESVTQGEDIRVNFKYEVKGTLPRTGITTYYRFDGQGTWYSTTEAKRRVPGLYESMISAEELYSHDYVEFYVSADNQYRSTLTNVYKVNIEKIGKVDGVRSNISEGENVRGTVAVTGNDGTNNSSTVISLDGNQLTTSPMLEDGAYFTFEATGRDSYFENALMTPDDKTYITSLTKWQYNILDGQVVKIDSSYFDYNEEHKTYDTTLRFRAGTYGATVDDYLMPNANHEDFDVSNLAMHLTNGNTYLPTLIGPDDTETSAKTNLSTAFDAAHKVGDSAGMCPYMDVSFSIPDSEVTAVGAEVDTTKLADGIHTLVVSNSKKNETINFVVDNTAPEVAMGIAEGQELTGTFALDPQASDANTVEGLVVMVDDKEVETPYSTTAAQLGSGAHKLTAIAKDVAGNETTKTVNFTVADVALSLADAGTTDVSDTAANMYVTLAGDTTNAKVDFHEVDAVAADQITSNTTDGILPYITYEVNVGNVKNDADITLSWGGTASNIDATHANNMYAQNVETGSWDKVGRADTEGTIDASFAAANHVKDGKVTLLVQCTTEESTPDLSGAGASAQAADASNWDGNSVPEDYDFAFAWETDTQYYAEEFMTHYTNMNTWIKDNAEAQNIDYVIHTGDIVDDYDMIYEWENADKAMKILDDAKMPYGVLGGNHDVAAGMGAYDNYSQYFGDSRVSGQSVFGDSYKNNAGHYDLLTENGQDMIILYMSWNIYQEEIDWMNQVLAQYSDRMAILCFHTYTNVKKSNGDSLLDYFGQLVQEQVVAKNPNVAAVLNGHYHGSSYETTMFDDDKDGKYDRTVYQICTDYQSGFEGGNGYIKMLYFDLDNGKIYVNSYSPSVNDFNYYDNDTTGVIALGEEDVQAEQPSALNADGSATPKMITNGLDTDTLTLNLDFDTTTNTIDASNLEVYVDNGAILGSIDVDATTHKAILPVSSLLPETNYIWYATINNANSGSLTTGRYTLTTAKEQIKASLADGSYTLASGKDATLTSTIDLAQAQTVLLDGTEVAPANYRIQGRNLILGHAYLDTLSAGTHNVTLKFKDGTGDITADLKLEKPKTNPGSQNNGGANLNLTSPVSGNGNNDGSQSNKDVKTPDTGDTNQSLPYAGLLVLGATGIALCWKRRREVEK